MLPAEAAWVSGPCEQKAVQSSERKGERGDGGSDGEVESVSAHGETVASERLAASVSEYSVCCTGSRGIQRAQQFQEPDCFSVQVHCCTYFSSSFGFVRTCMRLASTGRCGCSRRVNGAELN